MILPSSAKESESFIYIKKEDANAIKNDVGFTPIIGAQSDIHGNIIGFINGKTVIIVRDV